MSQVKMILHGIRNLNHNEKRRVLCSALAEVITEYVLESGRRLGKNNEEMMAAAEEGLSGAGVITAQLITELFRQAGIEE